MSDNLKKILKFPTVILGIAFDDLAWASEQSHLLACKSCYYRDGSKYRQSCVKKYNGLARSANELYDSSQFVESLLALTS